MSAFHHLERAEPRFSCAANIPAPQQLTEGSPKPLPSLRQLKESLHQFPRETLKLESLLRLCGLICSSNTKGPGQRGGSATKNTYIRVQSRARASKVGGSGSPVTPALGAPNSSSERRRHLNSLVHTRTHTDTHNETFKKDYRKSFLCPVVCIPQTIILQNYIV